MTITKDVIQSKCLEVIKNHKRCGVNISMGVGKTRLALKHMKLIPADLRKVLVVVPKLSIIESWKNEMDNLNIDESLIEFVHYRSLTKKNPNDYYCLYLDECHNLLSKHLGFLYKYKGHILGLTGTKPVRKTSEKYRLVNQYCPMVFDYTVDEATSDNILNDYEIYIHYLNLSEKKNVHKKTKTGGFYQSEVNDYKFQT